MKRLFALSLLAAFVLSIEGCGGGTGSSPALVGNKTAVMISLGQTRAEARSPRETAAIPASIATVKVSVTAPDMVTIERVIPVAGQASISVTIDVPNGPDRHFVAEAADALGNILYRGETFASLDGTPITLSIVMVSTDLVPPAFSGLSAISLITSTSMRLSWSAATDNITPQDKIQYLIYVSTSSGGENFSTPNFTTVAGATSFDVTGLNPDTTYYFVVRAMDERGNIDTNLVEKAGKTLSASDTQRPVFGGLVLAKASSNTEIELFWVPASDNVTPQSGIVYLIYMSATSGGENFSSPSMITAAGANAALVTGLNPDTTYFFVVRARDEAGNIDTNTVEKSATTLGLTDLFLSQVNFNGLDLTFLVNNSGPVDVQNVDVFVMYGDISFSNCQVFSLTVPAGGFVPGGVFDVSAIAYKIIVDPFNLIPEADKSNNTACSGSFCTSPPPLTLCTGGLG